MSENKEPKMLYCDQCNYKTPFPSNLNSHKKVKHLKMLVKYRCTYCGQKKYKTKYDLKKHVKKDHGISVNGKGAITCTNPESLEEIGTPREILLDEIESVEDKQYIERCMEQMNNEDVENTKVPSTSQISPPNVEKGIYNCILQYMYDMMINFDPLNFHFSCK